MDRWISRGFILSLAFAIVGCGESPTTPQNPSTPTVVSIAVTSASGILKIGQTETFTAMAQMSDGTQKAASGTWSSNDTNVAQVNSSSGSVTIVGAGTANITMTYSGMTGSKAIRGIPDFQGTWMGNYIVVSCAATEDWETAGFCGTFPPGLNLPISMTFDQTDDTVGGTVHIGPNVVDITSGQIAANGELSINAMFVNGDASIEISSTLSSTTPGHADGSLFQRFTNATRLGDAQLLSHIATLDRVGPAPYEAGISGLSGPPR